MNYLKVYLPRPAIDGPFDVRRLGAEYYRPDVVTSVIAATPGGSTWLFPFDESDLESAVEASLAAADLSQSLRRFGFPVTSVFRRGVFQDLPEICSALTQAAESEAECTA